MGLTETEAVNEAVEVSLKEFQGAFETEKDDGTLQDTTEAAMVDSIWNKSFQSVCVVPLPSYKIRKILLNGTL